MKKGFVLLKQLKSMMVLAGVSGAASRETVPETEDPFHKRTGF